MLKEKWFNLQLFAGEGTGDGGGEGATPGAESVDAGHQRLRELGVPEAKIRKNRAYKLNPPAPKPAVAKQDQAQENQQEQVAAAMNPAEEETEATPATPPRMTWEEVKADPEFNREIQAIVQSRLRDAKGAEDALSKLTPALEVLLRQYDLDIENPDYEALAKAISNDKTFYAKRAVELGVDEAAAMRFDQADREQKRQARDLEQQRFQQHIVKLEQQGEDLKKVFPNFDLRKEMQNPVFARMTSPNVGISVQDAYYAVHRNEIQAAAMQVTAQKVAQKISNDIQAGNRRPNENGTSGQAPSVTTFDYRNASREQRNALKNRIRSGEKIYPGQM